MNTELEHLSPNGLMDSPEAKISSEHSSEEKSDSKRSGSKKRVVKRIPTQTKQKMKSPNEPKHDRPMSQKSDDEEVKVPSPKIEDDEEEEKAFEYGDVQP